MTKHTQGPWYLKGPDDIGDFRLQTDSKIPTLARINNIGQGAKPCEETLANAALIAAAPDLLRCLTNMTNLYEELQGHSTAYSQEARAAIAKAQGETP